MLIEPSKNSIKRLLIDNLDSGKLILVDPNVRQLGKSFALIEVAKETGIPILCLPGSVYYLNRMANCTVAWSSEVDIYREGKDVGFLVDEGVPMNTIQNVMRRVGRSVTLRTGFYTNSMFCEDMITCNDIDPVEECESEGCATPCSPTPCNPTPVYPTPECVTPLPQCPTPLFSWPES